MLGYQVKLQTVEYGKDSAVAVSSGILQNIGNSARSPHLNQHLTTIFLSQNLGLVSGGRSLEGKIAKENLIITESQVQALELKKQDDIAAGGSRPRISAICYIRVKFV